MRRLAVHTMVTKGRGTLAACCRHEKPATEKDRSLRTAGKEDEGEGGVTP
jgi:hypothetical protein